MKLWKGVLCMVIETYQSKLVLRILKSGETYRAKPNLTLRGEYAALIDMLGLKCECPIFGVVKGKKQKTLGKVSGSVKLVLEVPEEEVHLTEFSEWADFLYAYKFTMPGRYNVLRPGSEEEISSRHFQELLKSIPEQKKLSAYKEPQVVLEKLKPEWLKRYHLLAVPPEGLRGRVKALFKK